MKFTLWGLQEITSVLSSVHNYKVSLTAQTHSTTISNPGLSVVILHPVMGEDIIDNASLGRCLKAVEGSTEK